MKKLLALVLALVMTLSLCTVSNAAYSDAADVDYNEAVDVMSAVGVFQGADGKFSPKAELTREQAAKLIAYLDLGEKTAEALPAVKVFNDVEANRWSAKYIAYCADAGYINGVGDGNFDPAGKLTGYAFGKMLLCVLGYDAKIEAFTGSNWSIAVAKLMQSNDIAKSVDAAASTTLTREAAAQYCLNTLKATMVDYADRGTEITINGAVIATGASKAEAVTTTADYGATIENTDLDASSVGVKYAVQLGEKLYDGDLELVGVANVDELGRPAHGWKYDGEEVGTYADAAKLVFTAETDDDDMYKALKGYKVKDAVTYSEAAAIFTVNKGTLAAANTTAAAVTEAEAAAIAALTGNGKTVEIFVNSSKEITKVVYIAPVFTQITNVANTSATSKRGAFTTYTFDSKSGRVYTTVVDKDLDTDELTLNGTFAKKDYVTYYATNDGYVMDPVTSVSGVLSAISSKGVYTIGGEAYEMSDAAGVSAPGISKTSQDFYVDQFGYILKSYTEAALKYAYVQNGFNKLTPNDKGYYDDQTYATLVFTDGTVETVKTTADWRGNINKVVTYTINSKGAYALGKVLTTDDSGLGTVEQDRAVSFTALAAKTKTVSNTNALNLNANTEYFVLKYVKDEDGEWQFDDAVTTYTGYANVPAYGALGKNGWAIDTSATKDGIADVVFIDTLAASLDTGKYVYVKGTWMNDGTNYVYDTIVAGADSTTKKASTGLVAADTLYSQISDNTPATRTGRSIQNKGGLLYISTTGTGAASAYTGTGSTVYTIADDVTVYTINISDDSVSVGTAEALDFKADQFNLGGTRGVYVEFDDTNKKATTVYILYNSEDYAVDVATVSASVSVASLPAGTVFNGYAAGEAKMATWNITEAKKDEYVAWKLTEGAATATSATLKVTKVGAWTSSAVNVSGKDACAVSVLGSEVFDQPSEPMGDGTYEYTLTVDGTVYSGSFKVVGNKVV